MRTVLGALILLILAPACRLALEERVPVRPEGEAERATPPPPSTARIPGLGPGARPGDAKSAGGFQARGKLRNFYVGRGGRLWYYMNCYYWVTDSAPKDDLWLKAEVVEEFKDLRTWPDGETAMGPEPKVTLEYWQMSKTGRSVRLDNHRDFFLLDDQYSAGAIEVKVTLTLGKLEVRDKRGRWGRSKKAYVLVTRNYSGGGGIGDENTRFVPLETEAVTVWAYRIPWDVFPQRMTRSAWQDLKPPSWDFVERREPPNLGRRAPVVTPHSVTPPR